MLFRSQDEPFFAALSRRIDTKPSQALPTAGVRVNPDTCSYEMIYNPEFFEGLTNKERKGVLIHEFYHLVFDHVTRSEERRVGKECRSRWSL